MRKIKWYSTATTVTNKRCSYSSLPSWAADVGMFKIKCEPEARGKPGLRRGLRKITGWYCVLYFRSRAIGLTKTRRLERLAKEDAHVLLERHLAGLGLVVVKDLKRDGLLNEVLSEIGVEI